MELKINGETRDLDVETLHDVLEELGLASKQGVAVAVDREVVPRSQWSAITLSPGQELEIIRAVQGG